MSALPNLLHQFLLDTAREPWESWYGCERLIFADWLDERGQPGDTERALALRTLEVVIADEIEPGGQIVGAVRIYPKANGQEIITWRLETAKSQKDEWLTLYENSHPCSPGTWQSWESTERITAPRLRLSLLRHINAEVQYLLYGMEGVWFGTLSLKRARDRCRQSVLDMFQTEGAGLGLVSQFVPSPVWFSNSLGVSPGFEEAYAAGQQRAYERERRMIEQFRDS